MSNTTIPGRTPLQIRLTPAEREEVFAALVIGYAAGAQSDGEALVLALRRAVAQKPQDHSCSDTFQRSISNSIARGWEPPTPRIGVFWTEREDADLREAWSTSDLAKLAIKHERTEGGVLTRAKMLKLAPLDPDEELSPSGKSIVKRKTPQVAEPESKRKFTAQALERLVSHGMSQITAEVALAIAEGHTVYSLSAARKRHPSTIQRELRIARAHLGCIDDAAMCRRIEQLCS